MTRPQQTVPPETLKSTESLDRPFIIGTAGHIDHGKTSLVQALTGINTDRLKEEQARGMSIELGFAYLDLPNGRRCGVVDVPGHERFVRAMLAGSAGVDLALLIVAADEGVMPQTREHFDILRLLSVPDLIVCITKCDLASPEEAERQVLGLLAGTSYAKASFCRFSAATGEGKELLISSLTKYSEQTRVTRRGSGFRLPIDRVFTIQGAGTVVTGTCFQGTIAVGDDVRLIPGDLQAKVRQVHAHGEQLQRGRAGMRLAINLAGIKKHQIERGMQVISPGLLTESARIEILLELLPSASPLRMGARVHLAHCAQEVLGRVILLGGLSEVPPGGRAFALIRLEEPTAPLYGDRVVLRSYSPVHTIGGGRILAAHPRSHRLSDPVALEELEARERGDWVGICRAVGKKTLLSASELSIELGINFDSVVQAAQQAGLEDLGDGENFVASQALQQAAQKVRAILSTYHEREPASPGLARQVLWGAFRRTEAKLAEAALVKLTNDGEIAAKGAMVALASHHAEADARTSELEELFRKAGINSPSLAEAAAALRMPIAETQKQAAQLAQAGSFVKIAPELYLHRDTVDDVKQLLSQLAVVSVQEVRNALNTSRKYVVPLLEYFDSVGVTRRIGNERVLRA